MSSNAGLGYDPRTSEDGDSNSRVPISSTYLTYQTTHPRTLVAVICSQTASSIYYPYQESRKDGVLDETNSPNREYSLGGKEKAGGAPRMACVLRTSVKLKIEAVPQAIYH